MPLIVLALRFLLDTELAVVGGERHCNAAPDEMKELADELRALYRQAGMAAPASEELFAAVDARAQLFGAPNVPPSRPASSVA